MRWAGEKRTVGSIQKEIINCQLSIIHSLRDTMKKLLLPLLFCPALLWGQRSVWLKGFVERQGANRPEFQVFFTSFGTSPPSPTSAIFTGRVGGTTFSPSVAIVRPNGHLVEWGFKYLTRREDQVADGFAPFVIDAGKTVYRVFESQFSYNYLLGIREKPLRFYLGWAFTFHHADLWFQAKPESGLLSRRRQSVGLNVGVIPRVQYYFNERFGIELNVFTEAIGLSENTFQDIFSSFGTFRDKDFEASALGHQHIQLGILWRLMEKE